MNTQTTPDAHTPITLFVGPVDCFERECEDFFTEDGKEIPGKDRCSHMTEQQVCEPCSTKGPDGDYEPVVAWTADHAAEGVR